MDAGFRAWVPLRALSFPLRSAQPGRDREDIQHTGIDCIVSLNSASGSENIST